MRVNPVLIYLLRDSLASETSDSWPAVELRRIGFVLTDWHLIDGVAIGREICPR